MLFIEDNTYKQITETKDKYKKQQYWKIAVGLNQVDDLKPSETLKKLAYENINNIKTYIEVEDELYKHYNKLEKINKSEYECDIVSLKIVKLLDDTSFTLTVNTLKNIHKELFENVINEKFCGEFRKYNIQKFEDILNGDSAIYGNFQTIEKDLFDIFDLLNKRKFDINNIKDIMDLSINCITDIWNIHPFVEGNTRTATIFTLKLLKYLGVENISNDLFKENSKYFRDCLVLSNYSELNRYGEFVKPDNRPLHRFFEKLLIDENLKLLEIEPVHNNKYYDKIENPSKLMAYEELNEDLDLDW